MKFITKENGQVSWLNALALLIAIVSGLYPIWQPFIPAEYTPGILAIIASLVFILRTFQSDGSPIVK